MDTMNDLTGLTHSTFGRRKMAVLSAAQRNKMKASQFADPEDRAYPINDKSHARNALARVSQHGSPEDMAEVRAKVMKKFPSINVKAARMAGKKK